MDYLENNYFNIKSRSIERIIYDLIEDARHKGGEQAILLLVLDSTTIKVISSFLNMSEILSLGLVSIEKLENKRVKYPNYHAIYYVSPSIESINLIVKDFESELNFQYSSAHIYFSSSCEKQRLESLVNSNTLRKIKTCKEFNLEYLIKDNNVFDLNIINSMYLYSMLPSLNKLTNETKDYINNISSKLFTVCASFKEYPYIQYQKNSSLSKFLAENCSSKLKDFYNIKAYNDNRGILLIVDRTIDLSSPLMYDYSYLSVLNDVMNINTNESFDLNDININKLKDNNEYKTINEEKSNNKYNSLMSDRTDYSNNKIPTTILLNNSDDIFNRYKYEHIVLTITNIKLELSEYSKSDEAKLMQSNMESLTKMTTAVKGIKSYKKKTTEFSTHIKLASKFEEFCEILKTTEVIDLQQEIITGLNESLNKTKLRETLTKIGALLPFLNSKQILRLVGLLPINTDINESSIKMIINDKLNTNEYSTLCNLKILGVNFSGISNKNTSYRDNIINDKELSKIKDIKNSCKYKKLIREPKLGDIVKECAENIKLNSNEFCFIEEPEEYKKSYKKNYNNSTDSTEEAPNLIIFVIGDLCFNELACIQRKVKEIKNFRVSIGANSIIRNDEYFDRLNSSNFDKK